MSDKTHWKKHFNYDYLGTYSLKEGQDMILTISRLQREKVKGAGGKEQECLVCYFVEGTKPMILNRTNCKTIKSIYNSPYIEDWVGKMVQLYPEKVNAFGVDTEGLRIRKFVPKPNGKINLTKDHARFNKVVKALKEGNADWKQVEETFFVSDQLKSEINNLIK